MKTPTFAKTCQQEVSRQIGIVYPFQFKGFETISLNYDCMLEEIDTYWDQEARFREGFEYSEDTVTIPNFFTKITGVHKDIKEYKKYQKKFTENENCLVFNSVKEFENTLNNKIDFTRDLSDEFFSFNQSMKKYEYSDIKKKDLEKIRFCNIPVSLKPNFIKAYEAILEKSKNKDFEKVCFTLADKYLTLLNSFDYQKDIPKIIINEQKSEFLDELDCLWLEFLNELCFDILIFAPAGNNDIETYLDINSFFLGTIDENYKLEKKKVKKENKGPFFKNCFLYFLYILPWFNLISALIYYVLVICNKVKETYMPFFFIFLGSIILSFACEKIETSFCEEKELNIDTVASAVFMNIIVAICLLAIFIIQFITSDKYITKTYSGLLDTKSKIVQEEDYSLNYDEIFYLDEDKDEFLLGYIGNHPNNKDKLRAEILIGEKEIFTITLNPMEYILGEKIDINLSKGETKAKLKFIFYDSREGFYPDKIDEYEVFEKDIILKKCTTEEIPKNITERLQEIKEK